jgi:transposase
MARAGPRKVRAYSWEFKRAAVELSRQVGVQVQTVAAALEIHPFMLSKWRKEFREGRMRHVVSPKRSAAPLREVKRLEAVERAHARLQEEHALLKKAIRSCSAPRARPSPLSTPSARP